MGERSSIFDLPAAARAALDARLIERGFRGYSDLADWLREQGYEVSRSAVHRYGSKLDQRMADLRRATDQAKALVAATPDDAGDVSEALMRLLQEKLFTLLMEMEVDPEQASLGAIAKAMAPLARASIALKKHAAEVRTKLDAASAELEAQAQAGSGALHGITPEAVAHIRALYTGAVAPPGG